MGKESSSKGRSSKTSKAHSSSRHKSSSGRHSTNGATSSTSGYPVSFLFAISEVSILDAEIDTWGNTRPPTSPRAYDQADHIDTPIMQYYDGIVMDVSHVYYWGRSDNGVGAIWVRTDPRDERFPQLATYKQSTICSCHPMLPFAMVDTDATVWETQVLEDGDGFNDLTWEPLRFFFPLGTDGKITGLSQVVFTHILGPNSPGGATRTHIAGRDASWLGRLVPFSYQNPSSSAPMSQGLGGELTILLGLMAFTAPGGPGVSRARTVFLGSQSKWRHRRWHHDRPLFSFNRSGSGLPQGLVVTIAYDPDNPLGSTEDALRHLESMEVAVKE